MFGFASPRSLRSCVFVAIAAISSASVQFAAAQDASLLENVPGDAVAVLTAYPNEVATHADLDLFPREVLSAVGMKEWTIDPLGVEKAVFVSGKFTDNEPPLVFLLLRFTAVSAAQKAFTAQRSSEKLEKIAGKDVYGISQGAQVLTLDDKTIAIGTPQSLTWMTKKSDQGTPFHALLKNAPKKHVSLAVHVEPIRPVLARAFAELPPPLVELSQGVELTRFVEAHIDLSLAGEWRLALQAANEKDAAALKKIAAAQVEFAAQVIRTQLPKAAASQDPVQRAWGSYLGRATQKLLEMTTPAQKGAEVSLTLKTDRVLAAAIGVFASTAAPAIMTASATAGRMQDQNRLKQLLLAMHNYHDTYRGFPQRAVTTEDGKPLLSWRVAILPFIEQQALYEQFRLDEPWDSDHNKTLVEKMPDVFRARGDAPTSTTTRFLAIIGEGALLDEKETVSLANVTDGTSNTIALVQAAKDKAVPWTKPDDLTLNEKKLIEGLLDAEAGGFLAALADGSVQWIPGSIDDATLKALITRAGGEVIQYDFGR